MEGNIYEETNCSTQAQAYVNYRPTNSNQPNKEQQEENRLSGLFNKIMLILNLFLAIVGVCLVIPLHFGSKPQTNPVHESYNNQKTMPKSCLEIRNHGITTSGFYYIQSKASKETFKVYCDMEYDGGGWTLVASINENNIDDTCSCDDVWTHHGTVSNNSLLDNRNWENTNTFGKVEMATVVDYKSQAYYELAASNVMIQHVVKNSSIENNETLLQYQSTNNFLQYYGGNLLNLYKKHYPLKVKEVAYFNVERVLDSLASRASEVSAQIPDVYNYQLGTDSDRITDHMFRTHGMRLYFYGGSYCSIWIQYLKNYRCPEYNIAISSRKSHPLFAIAAIGNHEKNSQFMYFQTYGQRPNTDAKITYNDKIQQGNFQINYRSDCRYNMTTPSICDVIYIISSKDLNSDDDVDTTNYGSYLYSTSYYFRLYPRLNRWSNMLVGYTLLSRTAGKLITAIQLKNAMRKILEIVASVSGLTQPCSSTTDGLVVPVTVSVDQDILKSTIPPKIVNFTTPGYIQFRSYGKSGSAYALCPGVKVNGCFAEYACIGGVLNSTLSFKDDCNDFLNWDGSREDKPLASAASGFAHSLRDINSTILIFYK